MSFMERRKFSPSRMGRLLFGNPSFVRVLMDGCSPRLDTADRVLVFMGLEPIGPRFRCEVDAYLAVTGAKATVVGEGAIGNRSFVTRLRNGSSPRLKTVDRVRAWMRQNASAEESRMIEVATREALQDEEGEGDKAQQPELVDKPQAALAGALFWSVVELAELLRMSRHTLDRYRVVGGGPPFLKLRGHIIYAREDVKRWLKTRRRSTTSDLGKLLADEPPGTPEDDLSGSAEGASPESEEDISRDTREDDR